MFRLTLTPCGALNAYIIASGMSIDFNIFTPSNPLKSAVIYVSTAPGLIL